MANCLRLDTQAIRCARALAFASAGSSNAASVAIMAMTTSNSTSVNAVLSLRSIRTPWLRNRNNTLNECGQRLFKLSISCAVLPYRNYTDDRHANQCEPHHGIRPFLKRRNPIEHSSKATAMAMVTNRQQTDTISNKQRSQPQCQPGAMPIKPLSPKATGY